MGDEDMCISGPGGDVLYCSCTSVTYRELYHGRSERVTLLRWWIIFNRDLFCARRLSFSGK